MVRFIHTGDWHIGVRRSFLAHKQEAWDKLRWQSFEKILKIARNKEVDFILIAGDLFDHNQVEEKYIAKALNLLLASPCCVMILPGNHDPLTYDSIYHQPRWKGLGRIEVFRENQPWQPPFLPEVWIHPAPISQKSSQVDPTEGMKGITGKINIGVAHGNLQIPGKIQETNFPIIPQRVEKAGLDYLALGEWHTWFPWQDSQKIIRTLYPGAPEATHFGEKNPGWVAYVEIEGPQAQPYIEKLEVASLKWHIEKLNFQEGQTIEDLNQQIQKIPSPSTTLLQIHLTGFLSAAEMAKLEVLKKDWESAFFYFQLQKEEVHLRPSKEELREILQKGGILGKIGEVLHLLEEGKEEEEKDLLNALPEEIRQALKDPQLRATCWLEMYQIIMD